MTYTELLKEYYDNPSKELLTRLRDIERSTPRNTRNRNTFTLKEFNFRDIPKIFNQLRK